MHGWKIGLKNLGLRFSKPENLPSPNFHFLSFLFVMHIYITDHI